MKKILTIICGLFILALMPGCSSSSKVDDKTLYIYNWEEYIDESLIDEFIDSYLEETGIEIDVVYNTFETNETMYNNFKTGKQRYDLICPSDYLIQKMMLKNELLPYDRNDDGTYVYLENYNEYASPYIKELFDGKEAKVDGEMRPWSDFAITYMWGTVGIIYNINAYDFDEYHDDMTSWLSLWDNKYKNGFTIKNSVRDTYFIGLISVYEEELTELADKYEANQISEEEYNLAVTEILNRCDDDSINEVEDVLKTLKRNSFGLEVDSGKNDILTGKISINIAWSGDAVYAIELAEENDVELVYSIPKLGSNIFFDGWVMPKGANTELAQAFVNFLCDPHSAVVNMYETGYTSSIAGQEVFDYLSEEDSEEEEEIENEEANNDISNDLEISDEELVDYDLTYFFDGTLDDNVSPIIQISEEEIGIISAQYVDTETIARCTIMEDFGDQNQSIVEMWNRVKTMEVPNWLYILVSALAIAFISGLVFCYVRKDAIRKRRKKRFKQLI